MSIDPELWGASGWSFLHYVAASYPAIPNEQERQNFKNFFEHLQNVLPCTECREHYTKLLQQMPIDSFLVSGQQLRQWLTSVHNTVNARVESSQRWTLAQVDAKYPPANPDDAVRVQHSGIVVIPPTTTLSKPHPSTSSAIIRQQHKLAQNNARMMGRIHNNNNSIAYSQVLRAK